MHFYQFSLFQFDPSDEESEREESVRYSSEEETPTEEKFHISTPKKQVVGKIKAGSRMKGQKKVQSGDESAPKKAKIQEVPTIIFRKMEVKHCELT